jgi:hypothetical protein
VLFVIYMMGTPLRGFPGDYGLTMITTGLQGSTNCGGSPFYKCSPYANSPLLKATRLTCA